MHELVWALATASSGKVPQAVCELPVGSSVTAEVVKSSTVMPPVQNLFKKQKKRFNHGYVPSQFCHGFVQAPPPPSSIRFHLLPSRLMRKNILVAYWMGVLLSVSVCRLNLA